MTDPSEALSALMTACYQHNVRGQNWSAVELSFYVAIAEDYEPDAALDKALAVMKRITTGERK